MKYHENVGIIKSNFDIVEEEEPEYIKIENENWDQIDEDHSYWEEEFSNGRYKNILLSR